MRRLDALLDLQKQRIVIGVPDEHCEISAGAYTAHTDNAVGNVDELVISFWLPAALFLLT